MKPALLEVMRMNRICRMVLATCLGSFILVIFYFQSMLHPGRGRVSVVLLNIYIFSALALSLAHWRRVSASSTLPLPSQPPRGSLLPGLPGSPSRDGEEEGRRAHLPPLFRLQAGGWEQEGR